LAARDSQPAPDALPRWRSPATWLFPLGLWIATRASLIFVGYLSLALAPVLVKPGGSPSLRPYPALDALCRWDCGWFDQLARFGYRAAKETNFWPGLPMAARALAETVQLPVELGILVIPNLACLGAYLVIHRLFGLHASRGAARTALTLFAAYPFAFFHASGYPETLMIFFSALSMLLALRGWHLLAGISLGLGVLSRHLTIFMGAGLLAAQLQERGWRRFFRSPLGILGLAMPFVAVGVYAVYCHLVWKDPLAFWKARNDWGQTAWWSIINVFGHLDTHPHIALFAIFALPPTVGALAFVLRRRAAVFASAVLPLLAIIWIVGAFGLGRYSASCWPAFLPIGEWLERHPAYKAPLLILLAMAQAWFFFLHIHHFEIQ
jgi:hypothetical protein